MTCEWVDGWCSGSVPIRLLAVVEVVVLAGIEAEAEAEAREEGTRGRLGVEL